MGTGAEAPLELDQRVASLSLDLRGTACPVNFIRTRLALETIEPGAWLQVDLDAGEPERLTALGIHDGVELGIRLGGALL